MSASTELTRSPPEFVLRPILTAWPMDAHGRVASSKGDGDDEDVCRTPTAEESKLPSMPQSCPPAPRKPRRVVLCKRRFWSEEEFIIVGAKEMEQLFRPREEPRVSFSHAKKRRCHQPADK